MFENDLEDLVSVEGVVHLATTLGVFLDSQSASGLPDRLFSTQATSSSKLTSAMEAMRRLEKREEQRVASATPVGEEPAGARLHVITGALMLSLFLAATETTFVTTAMPTIVAQLGGLSTFSWVFSGFMLSFTASIAVFGKLSDLFGRRRIYIVAMAIFLTGSLLCGIARDMTELIVYRILQGIGAGGLMPLIFAIIGEVYSFEQRARVQGLFASVWGLASILGPVLGGFLVDGLSWRWVFLLNLPAGLLATTVLLLVWADTSPRGGGRIDYRGAIALVGGIVSLLLALFAMERVGAWRSPSTWVLVAVAAVLWITLWRVERSADDPIVPVDLFGDRLFFAACGQAFAAGFAVFGSLTFIPLFVQTSFGVGATEAGAALIPLLLPWVVSSNVGSRLILRFSFRTVALWGVAFVAIGLAGLTISGIATSRALYIVETALVGIGMGLSSPIFLIAVQTSLPRAKLGTATSTLQLCRSIGVAIGVTVMGAILSYRVGSGLEHAREEPASSRSVAVPPLSAEVRAGLAAAERGVFGAAFLAALGSLAFTFVAPHRYLRGRVEDLPVATGVADQL
ncbi:MAG: MDR family MFS transporter [Burkholderiales bacterium]